MTNVVHAFLANRSEGESFQAWALRADEQLLRGEPAPALEGAR